MGLNQKSKMTFSVVMPPDGLANNLQEYMADFIQYLKVNTYRYAFSIHSLDVDDDGNPKRLHLHVYSEYFESERLSYRMRDLADVFHLNRLAISIKAAASESGCVKYLIHRGWPEKYQYEEKIIVSNYDDEDLQVLLNSKENDFNYHNLVRLCRESKTLLDVMEVIGLKMYRAYRAVIMDIWKEVHDYRA